jgi:hypothetical protein
MKKTVALCILLCLAAAPVLAKEYPISTRVLRPAKYMMTGVKKLAVTPFGGEEGSEVTNRLIAKLFEGGQYTLVDRAHINRIMEEHGLAIEKGIVSPDQAKQVGQWLGVDALVFGQVDGAEVNDQDAVTELYKNNAQQGGDPLIVKAPTINREARVSATFQTVNVESGEILAVENITRTWNGYQVNDPYPNATCASCYIFRENPMSKSVKLPSRSASLALVIDDAVQGFVNAISPHYETMTLVWDDDHGQRQAGEEVINLLKADMTKEADERMLHLRDEVEQNPKISSDPRKVAAVYYDCGLVKELLGDYEGASDWYKKAVIKNIKSASKLHTSAKTRSEAMIADTRKLQVQRQN